MAKLYSQLRAEEIDVFGISIPYHTKNQTLEIGLLEQMAYDSIGNINYNFFTNVSELKTSINSAWASVISNQKNKLASSGSFIKVQASDTTSNIYKLVDKLIDTGIAATANDDTITSPLDVDPITDGSNKDGYIPITFRRQDTISFVVTFNSPISDGRNVKYKIKIRFV